MSKDLIRRSDAIKAMQECFQVLARQRVQAVKMIEAIPSADRPQGAWIEMGQNEDGTHNVKCNQCDSAYKMRGHAKSISTKLKYRFCPHCGARMKGADDE